MYATFISPPSSPAFRLVVPKSWAHQRLRSRAPRGLLLFASDPLLTPKFHRRTQNLENWVIEGKPTGYPRPKPLNLIVLTDGAPDRGEDPEGVIVDIAQRLDKGGWSPLFYPTSQEQANSDLWSDLQAVIHPTSSVRACSHPRLRPSR